MEKKQVSQAFITRTITLNSRFSQKAYQLIFSSVSDSLYLLGIILRIIGTEKTANEVEDITDKMIAEVEEELTNERDRLIVAMEANGVDDMTASYTSPLALTIKLTSPRAARFVAMLQLLDDIAGKLDCLWLSSLLTDQQYSNAGYMWQRRIVRLANRIRTNTKRAIKSAKDKDVEKRDAVQQAVTESGIDLEAADIEGENENDVETEKEKKVAKKTRAKK